jgi:phosphotransferase system  glucose/maltose/N-acetylglucosamine-specific IIC component
MKSLIQTYLIGGGALGLVLSVPYVGFCLIMWRGFSGDSKELPFILGPPVICIVAMAAGVIWKRADQQRVNFGTKNPADAKPNSTNKEA